MFHFAWIDAPDAAFDPAIHAVEDLQILSLRIEQNENELARAEIEIHNPGTAWLLALGRRYALISEDRDGVPHLLFRGALTGAPSELTASIVTLEFLAESPQQKQGVRDLVAQLRDDASDHWDPLYVGGTSVEEVDPLTGELVEINPAVVIESRPAVLAYDRCDHSVALSDYLTGSSVINLDAAFALSVTPGEPPIAEAVQRVIVSWEQRDKGVVNLANRITRAFDHDLSTYTPDDLEGAIAQGAAIGGGNSGWTFLRHNLRRSTSDVVELFGAWGPDGVVGDGMREWKVYAGRLQHYELDAYYVRWDYRQSREETAEIRVKSAYQAVLGDTGRTEWLADVTLNDISRDYKSQPWQPYTLYTVGETVIYLGETWRCETEHQSADEFVPQVVHRDAAAWGGAAPTTTYWTALGISLSPLGSHKRASFFSTDRGRKALRNAAERARTRLIKRLRYLTISFTAPWQDLADVGIDHSMRIEWDKLPGGAAVGKMVRYALIADGNGSRYAEVSIGVSVGTGAAQPLPDAGGEYVDVSYDGGLYQSLYGGQMTSDNGLVLDVEASDLAQHVNLSALLRDDYACPEIRVVGLPGQQWTAMHAAGHGQDWEEAPQLAEQALASQSTSLSMRLRSLASEAVLTRRYSVETRPFQAPRGINLDGSAPV